ncbi:MAG: hypothetical protein KAH95_11620 [Spirochaetales bacterium]|nr:hypothetical protein [Spirochaetales bacterium]
MINDLLRHIQRNLKIDIDNDYFLDKIKSDLLFSENKLTNLYESLKDSTLQLDKDQYLRHLYKSKNLFIEIVENILNNSTGRSLDFSDFLPRLKEAVYEQQYEYNDIGDILSNNSEDGPGSDQISQEELMFLMSSEEEPEEEE